MELLVLLASCAITALLVALALVGFAHIGLIPLAIRVTMTAEEFDAMMKEDEERERGETDN